MKQQFNLTTAISYVNGPPHIGHSLEFLIADVISRYYKIKGHDVHFLTGTDEHGQKIQTKAETLNLSPKTLCDQYSEMFRNLDEKMGIEYDNFIRTTDHVHRDTVYRFFEKCKDDIYLGEYEGWYNPREERFVPLREAEANNYKDPTSGTDLIYSKEPSYFFALSKYQGRVREYIKTHPTFILPSSKTQSILDRLDNELDDLSISRTSIDWGIPVPNDPSHVFYVWFDALINYISGGPWPCHLHIIGKDILWFHTTIWLSMLLSAGYELPEHIYVHNFVNDQDGHKMSKSVGNVVDPNSLLEKYPLCAIRYYLISSLNYGFDMNFSETDLVRGHDSILLEVYGNYVNRVFGLVHKYCQSVVPEIDLYEGPFDLEEVGGKLDNLMTQVRLQEYLRVSVETVKTLNGYINETHIWTIGKKEDERTVSERDIIVKQLVEGLYIVTHFLYPVIPYECDKVFEFLGQDKTTLGNLCWNNLGGLEINKERTILFEIIDKDSYANRKKKNIKKSSS